MPNEIATVNESSSLEVLPPAKAPSTGAVAMLREHAEIMATAYEFADFVCRSPMVPQRFLGKPQDATAAILYGSELGLTPMQSLQRVIPIHGMPSLEARTMVALLKNRGYKFKTLEQSDDRVTVEGHDLDGERHVSQWTIDRAIQAGYVPTPTANSQLRPGVQADWETVNRNGKTSVLGNMKYITDPQAMLKAKAQAEVCRDMAPDVLLGMPYTREDLESEQYQDPTPEPTRGTAPLTVEEILADDQVAAPPEPVEKAPAKRTRRTKPAAERREIRDADTCGMGDEAGPPQDPDPTTAEPEVPMVSGEALVGLNRLRLIEGFDDTDEGRAAWLDWLTSATARDITDNRQLTLAEANDIIKLLEESQKRDDS